MADTVTATGMLYIAPFRVQRGDMLTEVNNPDGTRFELGANASYVIEEPLQGGPNGMWMLSLANGIRLTLPPNGRVRVYR